jgi:AraC-like DNA-binding protein|tara:strand:- start:8466 stop:9560 length:1095 start_codon:yes stop_codon:yes gene_type:complete
LFQYGQSQWLQQWFVRCGVINLLKGLNLYTFPLAMAKRIFSAAKKIGVDTDKVVVLAGLANLATHNTVSERVDHAFHNAFWPAIETVSQDPNIGLHIGEEFIGSGSTALEYLFLSSASFGEALARSQSYTRLISDSLHIELKEALPGHCRISFQFSHESPELLRQVQEMAMTAYITFFRLVTDNAFTPVKVEFAHSAPKDVAEHLRIFGCEVEFDCKANAAVFPEENLSAPCLHSEPTMRAVHEKIVGDQLTELEKRDFIDEVQTVVAELLDSGEVSLDSVSAQLGIKPAQLRYQLSDIGTSFSQVFADYRLRIAKRLLAETTESIDQIIITTGFSEPSPFYRAFKRWTGITPIAYREKYRIDK